MFIYNITIKVDWSIQEEWLTWMKETHLPEILETKCFVSYRMLRLMGIEESDGPTYAIQLEAESKALYNMYSDKYEPLFARMYTDKWNAKMLFFSTLMQVVD